MNKNQSMLHGNRIISLFFPRSTNHYFAPNRHKIPENPPLLPPPRDILGVVVGGPERARASGGTVAPSDGDRVVGGGVVLGARPRPEGAPEAELELFDGVDVALGLAELGPLDPTVGVALVAGEGRFRDRDWRQNGTEGALVGHVPPGMWEKILKKFFFMCQHL